MKKIANLAKFNIKLSFKKIHALIPRIHYKKYIVWREYKALFLTTFNIISYIFPENFIEIYLKLKIFTSSILTIFVDFLDFLPLIATKNLMTPASIKWHQQFFDLGLS